MNQTKWEKTAIKLEFVNRQQRQKLTNVKIVLRALCAPWSHSHFWVVLIVVEKAKAPAVVMIQVIMVLIVIVEVNVNLILDWN